MTADRPPLVAEDVGFSDGAGRVLLDNLTLALAPREVVGLVGPAGGGKTLLLKLLYGLVRPTVGDVWLLGQATRDLGHPEMLALWRRVGFLFAEGALLSNLTVRANVELPLRYRGELDDQALARRTDELLAALDLEAFSAERPAGLGLGVRKRAALARSLAVRPELLLADEPFEGGDRHGQELVVGALASARERWGAALLLTLADVDRAEGLCDRVLELDEAGMLTEVAA